MRSGMLLIAGTACQRSRRSAEPSEGRVEQVDLEDGVGGHLEQFGLAAVGDQEREHVEPAAGFGWSPAAGQARSVKSV